MIKILSLLIGALYGYGSVKGQFCMNSGFSNVIRTKDTTKMKSFITAILIQTLLLPVLFTGIYLYNPDHNLVSHLGLPPLFILASAIGGFLFGISMYYSAGCGAGIFYKIGEKNSGAILSVIGFVCGIYLIEYSFLNPLKTYIQSWGVFTQSPFWTLEHPFYIAGLASLVSLVLLVFLFKKTDNAPKGAVWGWKKTGIWIGLVGIVGWILALLAQVSFGMAIIPGVLEAVNLDMSWGFLFVLGILLGSFYSTRNNELKKFSWPKKSIIGKRLLGGLGLGLSGSIAAGCTVGHGLTFVPLLGIGSLVTITFIFLGSGFVGYLTRK